MVSYFEVRNLIAEYFEEKHSEEYQPGKKVSSLEESFGSYLWDTETKETVMRLGWGKQEMHTEFGLETLLKNIHLKDQRGKREEHRDELGHEY